MNKWLIAGGALGLAYKWRKGLPATQTAVRAVNNRDAVMAEQQLLEGIQNHAAMRAGLGEAAPGGAGALILLAGFMAAPFVLGGIERMARRRQRRA